MEVAIHASVVRASAVGHSVVNNIDISNFWRVCLLHEDIYSVEYGPALATSRNMHANSFFTAWEDTLLEVSIDLGRCQYLVPVVLD